MEMKPSLGNGKGVFRVGLDEYYEQGGVGVRK